MRKLLLLLVPLLLQACSQGVYYVNSDNAPLLVSPGDDADLVTGIPRGTKIRVKNKRSGYSHLTYENQTGYMRSSYLTKATRYNPSPNKSPSSGSYTGGSSSSRTIHTGPKGGKYYINSKGKKTYVKRK